MCYVGPWVEQGPLVAGKDQAEAALQEGSQINKCPDLKPLSSIPPISIWGLPLVIPNREPEGVQALQTWATWASPLARGGQKLPV